MEKRGKSWKYTLKHMKKTWTFHWCHNMSQLFQRQAKVGQTTAVSGTTEDRNWNEFWYLRSFKPVESSWIIDGNGFSADVQNQGKYCGKLFMPEHLGVQFFHHLKSEFSGRVWDCRLWTKLAICWPFSHLFPHLFIMFHHLPSFSLVLHVDYRDRILTPRKLTFHQRYFCGPNAEKTKKQQTLGGRTGLFFCIKSPKVFNDYVLTIYSLKSERESESVPTDYWSHYCIF